MGKRTVFECDSCGKWSDKHDVHIFKEAKYTWRDGWTKCKFYMCFDCKTSILEGLRRKQIRKELQEDKKVK